MTDNLNLWQAVERTPTEHTKKITGKSYQGTSPKPHYLIHKATETFGPCGIGWGFTIEERIEQGALISEGFYEKMSVAKVKVWYIWGDKRGEVEHIGGTVFSGKYSSGKTFTDEDAPKKSVTDALVKALSMIGFAGDIFMGRYDDSKYVSELKDEEYKNKQPTKPAPKPAEPDPRTESLYAELEAIGTLRGLSTFWGDNKQVLASMDPADLKRFTSLKDKKKLEFEDTVAKIQDDFPGSRIVNEHVQDDFPLKVGV